MTAPTPDLIRAAWQRHEAVIRQKMRNGHGPTIWIRVRQDGEVIPIPFTLKRTDWGNSYVVDGDGLELASGEWPV